MFNKYPVNPVREPMTSQPLLAGFDSITSLIVNIAKNNGNGASLVAIDGTHGADFHKVLQRAVESLEKQGFLVDVHSTSGYTLSGEELRQRYAANITDNRAFGYMSEGSVANYFREDAQQLLSTRLAARTAGEDAKRKVSIVFGPGADWLTQSKQQLLLFLDLSREAQQVEHKKQLLNFGMTWNRDSVEKYKIALFLEWPILETYRKLIFDRIDYYIDMNRADRPITTSATELTSLIKHIAQAPMRVKPFFAPGVWGGQYLKEKFELPQEWVNCAWGFEPIAPENSILIGCGEEVIEVPFLIVMALEHLSIMGERPVRLFGDYFPVRFDYLDTMDGDNLSCQVHPKQEYIKEKFNERMAQQESYYIMERQGDAKVYLGFTESATEDGFLNAVQHAQNSGVPMPFTEYVNEFDADKGDLFLIPTGTIHCSGKDNMVLEISSTTWWFTFKIYDYLRKDLDGKPRPINIDHGFQNLDFYKDTAWVKQNLIPSPQLLNKQGDNEEYMLGQREDLLFYVKRVHLNTEWLDDTHGEFVMYNLVEGERVRIVSCQDESIYVELAYAESYILPSVFGAYKIVNQTSDPCKLIKAGVSSEWDVRLP